MVDVTGYTQAGADALLAAKANSADLAPVATSGAYSSLTGLPTIPAAQVASDWTASTGVAAILNKPALGTAAAQNVSAFATAAQGAKADSAVQPAALSSYATTTALTTGLAGKQDAGKVGSVTVTGTPATGQILTATGTTAATWQAPAGGSSVGLLPAIGQWYAIVSSVVNSAGFTPAIGTEYAIPLVVTSTITISKVGTRIWTGQTSLVGRFGIYADANGQPSTTAQNDLGTVSMSGAGGVITLTPGTPITLAPGVYWLSLVEQVGTTPAQFTTAQMSTRSLTAVAADFTSGTMLYWARTGSTGALSGNAAAWAPVFGAWNANVPPMFAYRSA